MESVQIKMGHKAQRLPPEYRILAHQTTRCTVFCLASTTELSFLFKIDTLRCQNYYPTNVIKPELCCQASNEPFLYNARYRKKLFNESTEHVGCVELTL